MKTKDLERPAGQGIDPVDEAGMESFPCSDPPSHNVFSDRHASMQIAAVCSREPSRLSRLRRGLARALWTRRAIPYGGNMNARKWANGLGWFSIGLGLTEILAARPMAKGLGIKSSAMLRAFGAREIAAGVGLLMKDRKGPWIWARIAGDALDVGVLGTALSRRNPRRGNAALALGIVAPVVIADLICGRRLGLSA